MNSTTDTTGQSIAYVLIGLPLLAAIGYAIWRQWKRKPGLRMTQRWANTITLSLLALIPLALVLLGARLTIVYYIVLPVVLIAGVAGLVVVFVIGRFHDRQARLRDIGLGVPSRPREVEILVPFILIAFLMFFVVTALVYPWVILGYFGEQMQAWINAGMSGYPGLGYPTTDDRFLITLGVCGAIAAAIAGVIAVLRWWRRRTLIHEHDELVAGIQSRERASYERGYSDAQAGTPPRP